MLHTKQTSLDLVNLYLSCEQIPSPTDDMQLYKYKAMQRMPYNWTLQETDPSPHLADFIK